MSTCRTINFTLKSVLLPSVKLIGPVSPSIWAEEMCFPMVTFTHVCFTWECIALWHKQASLMKLNHWLAKERPIQHEWEKATVEWIEFFPFQFLDMVPLIPSGLFDFGKAFFCTLCSLVSEIFASAIEGSLTTRAYLKEQSSLVWAHTLPYTSSRF